MALPPWFAYGLDRAIRDRSPAGGLLAGLALLFSYTADLHVFYFTILIAPLWALISFHIANPSWRTWPHAILKLWSPLLPLIALTALAVVISVIMSRHLGDTVMAGGRRLSELAAYSPKSIGLIATASAGMTSHVYVGIPFFQMCIRDSHQRIDQLLHGKTLARVQPHLRTAHGGRFLGHRHNFIQTQLPALHAVQNDEQIHQLEHARRITRLVRAIRKKHPPVSGIYDDGTHIGVGGSLSLRDGKGQRQTKEDINNSFHGRFCSEVAEEKQADLTIRPRAAIPRGLRYSNGARMRFNSPARSCCS